MSSLPDPYAGLKVIGISLISSIAAELIMWAWAYRHPSFRSLKDTLEKQTRKLDQLKAGNSATLRAKNKKVERLEAQMKNTVLRELQAVKLKQGGVAFLYALCQMGIRPNIVKLLDVGPSRKMNAIQAPTLAVPAE